MQKTLFRIIVTACLLFTQNSNAEKLRLLTWGSYAPEKVVELFEKEYPNIEVEVTFSNNEDMVNRLIARNSVGFDLAQPSHDRIYSVQLAHDLYRPIDLTKIDLDKIDPALLDSVKANTTIGGKLFSIPHLWGTSGLIVNSSKAGSIKSWADLCDPQYKGKTSIRLKRTILLGMAFAMGENPFEAYSDLEKYQQILDAVAEKLISCKDNIHTYWKSGSDLSELFLTDGIVASDSWDYTAYVLHRQNPAINFVPPKEGALAWIDTFAIPKNGKADDAAYKWINFVMQPKIITLISDASGAIAAVKNGVELMPESSKAAVRQAFDIEAIDNLRYFVNIPPGVEMIEQRTLQRIIQAVEQ